MAIVPSPIPLPNNPPFSKESIDLDPQLVASTFIALGFRLYRTSLDQNDFQKVLETFVEKAKDIRPFTEIIDKTRVH